MGLCGEGITAAVEGIPEGGTHIDPAVADKLVMLVRQWVKPDPPIAAEVTEREIVVLRHLARGLTYADIAEKLFLAKGTVRNRISFQGEQGLSSLSGRRRLIEGHRIIGRTCWPTVVCPLASTGRCL